MKTAINAIVGLALFAFGAWFLNTEMSTPPTHTMHIMFFGGCAVIGLLVIRPDPIFAVVVKIVKIAGPYIPVIGGRRAGDPPAPDA